MKNDKNEYNQEYYQEKGKTLNRFIQNDIVIKVFYKKPFNEICAICLEINNDNKILKCHHLLCKSCYYLLKNRNPKCPMCKRSI